MKKKSFQGWAIPCLLPVACFVLLSSCAEAPTTTEEAAPLPSELKLTAAQEKNFGISLGTTRTQLVYDAIALNGTVEAPPQQTASVSFPIAGMVRSIGVQTGQTIGKGSTLATVESLELIQLQEDYWKTRGQLTFAEQERQRQTTLAQEDIGAKRKLQQAEADVRVLEATQQGLEAKLQLLGLNPQSLKTSQIVRVVALRAPIAGVVKRIQANIGMTVKAGDVLFEIVNQTGARLVLKVFEKDLPQIKIGQKVMFEGGSATIVNLSNNFDATTRTVDAYATLNGARVLAGQYISGKVETAPRQATVLPETAVVRTGETAHVFVKTSAGVFQPVEIKTGATQDGFVEVIFAQKPTLPIVLTGAQTLQAELIKGEGEEE
ncbi:MAG: efflux RND transporter periplasmic adaptor subunit [Spirosomaceae bacterium]|jgi:cobalt-zinc-cadmium efflux system membrane fusion protein|nr:efflux RND transporter periplasmic adaptor subunit [Spirosomataceae bacterium]